MTLKKNRIHLALEQKLITIVVKPLYRYSDRIYFFFKKKKINF